MQTINLRLIYSLIANILVSTSLLLAMGSFTYAKYKTVTFWVNHDCPMCSDRIIKAVDLPGVKAASYDEDSEMLTVSFNVKKITVDQLHQAVANAGYDTALKKATDEAYKALPDCCQYDRSKKAPDKKD